MFIGSDSVFKDQFLEGAARAFFVMAYANYVEEGDSTDNTLSAGDRIARQVLPRPGGGEDWYDYAPETPIAAYALAGEMWAELEQANGTSVYALANRARVAEHGDDESPSTEIDAEEFGRDLAMQYMGTGVSWFDDHATFDLKVPHAEVSEFSFDSATYTAEREEG